MDAHVVAFELDLRAGFQFLTWMDKSVPFRRVQKDPAYRVRTPWELGVGGWELAE